VRLGFLDGAVDDFDGIEEGHCSTQAGTDLFLTNDKRLVGKIVPGIQFIAALDTPLL